MPTASLSSNDSHRPTQVTGSSEAEDRKTFSHQTLILTALAAINNPSNHPTFKAAEVNKERIQYMKDTAIRTPIIDAATTILVTDTEILATMASVYAPHSIVALKKSESNEDQAHNKTLDNLFEEKLKFLDAQSSMKFWREMDGVLPDDLGVEDIIDEAQHASKGPGLKDKDIFISMPNINQNILIPSQKSTERLPINSHQSSTSNDPICKPIAVVDGRWQQIWESKSGFIFEATKISFESHVATVQEYLNWYRAHNGDNERRMGSAIFSEYLISACWSKMMRRIGHWAAVGLMYNLKMARVSDLQFQSLIIDDEAPGSDFKLSMYLRVIERNESLEKILSYHKYNIPSDATLPKDTTVKIVLPCLQRLCHEKAHNLYNKETVAEFHHLLVATMLCYASALRDLCKAFEKLKTEDATNSKTKKMKADPNKKRGGKEENLKAAKKNEHKLKESETDYMGTLFTRAAVTEEKQATTKLDQESSKQHKEATSDNANTTPLFSDIHIKSAAHGVFYTSRLLNAILASSAFRRHIKLLVEQRFLLIPSDRSETTFYRFAIETDIPWQQSRSTRTQLGQTLTFKKSDGSDNAESDDSDTINLERDQDPFSINDEEEITMAILGWMKIFVQHLHAKNTLESFAKRGLGNIPIEIKVYGVSQPASESLLLPTWETLEKIMRSSLQDSSEPNEEQNKIINTFLSYFKTSDDANDDDTARAKTGGNALSPSKNRIFNVIGDIIAQKTTKRFAYYNIHCETALAGLAAVSNFPEKLAAYVDKDFASELNGLNQNEVAASKLCCPACWEYFDILTNKLGLYKIRGRHSTVYPVQLPSWISPDIVQELIRRFNDYLRTELLIMMTNFNSKAEGIPKSGHTHNPSLQSVASAISNASDDSTESNLDNLNDFDFPSNEDRVLAVKAANLEGTAA